MVPFGCLFVVFMGFQDMSGSTVFVGGRYIVGVRWTSQLDLF